jgi:hypothetical protein
MSGDDSEPNLQFDFVEPPGFVVPGKVVDLVPRDTRALGEVFE